jgi:hypothetical protein
MPTMHRSEICVLRTQLRELNIEFSALVRAMSGEAGSARMAELRSRRRLLMARIAEVAPHSRPAVRAHPAQAPLDVAVQAA